MNEITGLKIANEIVKRTGAFISTSEARQIAEDNVWFHVGEHKWFFSETPITKDNLQELAYRVDKIALGL